MKIEKLKAILRIFFKMFLELLRAFNPIIIVLYQNQIITRFTAFKIVLKKNLIES